MDEPLQDPRTLAAVRVLLDRPNPDSSALVDALFRHEATVPAWELDRRIGAGAVPALLAAGLVRATEAGIVSTARFTRFGGRLIASDRMSFRHHRDFVLGPGPATATLAHAVRPVERGRVLDLGCGPGTLALWLGRPGVECVGLDIADRALAFATFNARMNEVAGATFRRADVLTAPADAALDGRFDVCVANPPFVLAPTTTLVYRDGPLPGDATTQVALERVERALAPGGRGYVIGSWADDARGRWDARPRTWLRRRPGRAMIARISSMTPAAYARSWTTDLDGSSVPGAGDAWQRWLEGQGIRRITTGVIAIARPRRWAWRRGLVDALEMSRPGWRAVEALLAGR